MDEVQRRARRQLRWLFVVILGSSVVGPLVAFAVVSARTGRDVVSLRGALPMALGVLASVVVLAAFLALGRWYTRRRGVSWMPLLGVDRATGRRVMRAVRDGVPPENPQERQLAGAEARRAVALTPVGVVMFAVALVSQVVLMVLDHDDDFLDRIRPAVVLFFLWGTGYQYWYWRRAKRYLVRHDAAGSGAGTDG